MISKTYDEKFFPVTSRGILGIPFKKQIHMGVDAVMAQNSTSSVFVPYRFALMVFLHLMKNYLVGLGRAAELILAVAGKFGVGKSVIIAELCRRLKIRIFRLGINEMSSMWEGEPAKAVARKYYQASKTQIEEGVPCCLIIEDLDMAVGNHSEFSSGTMNTQFLINEIMELASNPTQLCGEKTVRVPIFVTANDLSAIYAAVTRPQRMRAWTYQPDSEEIFEVGRHILENILTVEQINELKAPAALWVPAHFGQLKTILQEKLLERQCRFMTAADYIDAAVNNDPAVAGLGEGIIDNDIFTEAIREVENGQKTTQTSYVES